MTTDLSNPLANRLLASLSLADYARLKSSLKLVSLKQHLVLNEPGDEVEQVYFPHTGMISQLAVMMDGKAVETATVGSEGVVGAMAGLGLHVTPARIVVQTPLIASQIAAAPFRRAVLASDGLRDMIVRSNEELVAQVQMTAACNALHPIQERLARWILQTHDRVENNRVPLTQELLSEMLGVRRSSVSEIASKLQSAGLIEYSRGIIGIINRRALEAAACECYGTINRLRKKPLVSSLSAA